MNNKYKRKLLNKKYISFDIFDTLIKRCVSTPQDIFNIVENEYNSISDSKISNFREIRINAEKECRLLSKKEEITIDEIYDKLSNCYSYQIRNILKKIEIETEINLCKFNNEIKQLYDWCIANKKKVVITSDMYLDEAIIKRILKINNIQYEKLYLSSNIKLTKRSGSIFSYILKDLGINSKSIIHIGDNYKSDYLSPKKYGISSINWKNKKTVKNNDNSITKNIIINYLNNCPYDKKNFFEKFGYNAFGPLLLCFSKWLLNELKKEKIKQVFFLSRDGFIMKKAFDLINNDNIESKYLYASRRSIIVPSLYKCKNIEEIFSKMHINDNINIKSLLKKIGLDDIISTVDFTNKYNVDIEKEYKFDNILKEKNIKFMFDDLFHIIIENSKEEYNSLITYMKKMNFFGKIAIVDIGWFGNMQHALESLDLKVNIYGYYMGIEPRKNYQNIHKMCGFLFDKNKNFNLFLKEHNFNSIFETLFLAQHGSVKRFNKNENLYVELYDYEYETLYEEHNIKIIQKEALNFMKNFIDENLSNYLKTNLHSSFDFMCDILLNPTLDIANTFGDFLFLDDDNKFIAKPKCLMKYINLKDFLYDYKKSTWRIGFLKRLLKIKLPYYKINMFIRKCYLAKKEAQ